MLLSFFLHPSHLNPPMLFHPFTLHPRSFYCSCLHQSPNQTTVLHYSVFPHNILQPVVMYKALTGKQRRTKNTQHVLHSTCTALRILAHTCFCRHPNHAPLFLPKTDVIFKCKEIKEKLQIARNILICLKGAIIRECQLNS